MADVVYVDIDESKLSKAITEADGVKDALREKSRDMASSANSMSASFETEQTVNWATGEHVGGTRPEYGYDVKHTNNGYVGIVMPKNYAAMKDNCEHNTLLKAKG